MAKALAGKKSDTLKELFASSIQRLCSHLILHKALRHRVHLSRQGGTLTFGLQGDEELTWEHFAEQSDLVEAIGQSNFVALVLGLQEPTSERIGMPAIAADAIDFLKREGVAKDRIHSRTEAWRAFWAAHKDGAIGEGVVLSLIHI